MTLRRGIGSQLISVAVGQRGDMLVAVRRKGALETPSRGPAGRWGAARRLLVADHRVDAMRAAIGPHGAAWLLWWSTRNGVRTVGTASRPPHGTRFGRVRVLGHSARPSELGDNTDRWRLRLAAPERGTGATAASTSAAGPHQRVMVALAKDDDPLGWPGPVTPADGNHVVGDLALGAGRQVIAIVSRPAESRNERWSQSPAGPPGSARPSRSARAPRPSAARRSGSTRSRAGPPSSGPRRTSPPPPA